MSDIAKDNSLIAAPEQSINPIISTDKLSQTLASILVKATNPVYQKNPLLMKTVDSDLAQWIQTFESHESHGLIERLGNIYPAVTEFLKDKAKTGVLNLRELRRKFPKLPGHVLNVLTIATALSLPVTSTASSKIISPEQATYSTALNVSKPERLECLVQDLRLAQREAHYDNFASEGYQPDEFVFATLFKCSGPDGENKFYVGSMLDTHNLPSTLKAPLTYDRALAIGSLNTPDSKSSSSVGIFEHASERSNCFNYALREIYPEVFKNQYWTGPGILEFVDHVTEPVIFLTRTDTFDEGEENGLFSPLSMPFAEYNTFIDHVPESLEPLIPGWSSDTTRHETEFFDIDPKYLEGTREGDLIMYYAVQEKPDPLIYPVHAGVVHFDENGDLRITSKFGLGPVLETSFNQTLYNYGSAGVSAIGIYRPKNADFSQADISNLFDNDALRTEISKMNPP